MDDPPQFAKTASSDRPQSVQSLHSEDVLSVSGESSAEGSEPSRSAVMPEPGSLIGRYRIRETIGEGGMGVVYAADDSDLGRVVAIKLLRGVQGSEAEVHQRRLLREAQALARVSHRNLVTVFDVGTHDGRVWVAMEYVVGQTLEDWLAAARRTWAEIVEVFVEAGRGLAAVHAAGLIHRDFKPGNVIVGQDGTVQVLDFGLAAQAGERLLPEARQEWAKPALDALAATLTETGGIMGTPAYMAPEQFTLIGVDARSDQFSYCVALFEALYGHRPFKGRDLSELMLSVSEGLLRDPEPIPGMPDVVREVIARGLRPRPEQRYADMPALLRELEAVLAPASTRRGGWRRFTLGVLVGGGLLGAGMGAWLSRESEAEPSEADPTAVQPTESTEDDAEASAPSGPDGQTPDALPAPLELPEPAADRVEAILPSLEDLQEQDTDGEADGEPAADTDPVAALPAPPTDPAVPTLEDLPAEPPAPAAEDPPPAAAAEDTADEAETGGASPAAAPPD